ncbi:hypothetical protein DFQ30_001435 [Apophysomyces sp. BC1015]|nr:hypothetical protein DFQ30_001435 [Apophysomyces sp. BC1015]
MCQLLGMNCAAPTDVTFSFTGFAARGGVTDHHADGFGIAFFEDKACRLFIDHHACATSPIAELVKKYPIKSKNTIAHIRKATQGRIVLENCHPFQRELWGRHWIFAHNGDLRDYTPALGDVYLPVGTTDSELAFCAIMQHLRERFPGVQPPLDEIFDALTQITREITQHGVFNFLMSNGQALFVHCSTHLYYLMRSWPFSTAHLIDADVSIDFAQYTTPEDRVAACEESALGADVDDAFTIEAADDAAAVQSISRAMLKCFPVIGRSSAPSAASADHPTQADSPALGHTGNRPAKHPLLAGLSADSDMPLAKFRKAVREISRENQPVSVHAIPGTGIVHVKIQGDSKVFDSVGMEGIDTSNGPKRLEYLAIPADRYAPHLAGSGKDPYVVSGISDTKMRQLMSPNQSWKSKLFARAPHGPVAYINGSFYGSAGIREDEIGVKSYATNAPIGDAKVKGVKQIEGVRPHATYEDDYHKVTFLNGSHVTLAPLLAGVNETTGRYENKFPTEKAADPKYVFENTPLNRPGELGHASHPNARSAIDFPSSSRPAASSTALKTNHYRMVVAADDSGVRGAKSTGMQMTQMGIPLARVGSFNLDPGYAVACDGGASTVMGAIDENGKSLLRVQGLLKNSSAVNFIAFAPAKSSKQPDDAPAKLSPYRTKE